MFSTEELESLDRSYFSVICADAYEGGIPLVRRCWGSGRRCSI